MRCASAASLKSLADAPKDQGRVIVAGSMLGSSERNNMRSAGLPSAPLKITVTASVPIPSTAMTVTGPAGSTPVRIAPREMDSSFKPWLQESVKTCGLVVKPSR